MKDRKYKGRIQGRKEGIKKGGKMVGHWTNIQDSDKELYTEKS